MGVNIVTGVAGFIGSHLAEALLRQGAQVIDIEQFNDYFKHNNIANLQEYSSFKLIKASIQDLDWQQLLQSVDVVYH